jgi:hypothetical protein
LPRSGKIISTPPVASHEVRLAAAALGVKVRKMAVDEESRQTLVVTVTSHCPPGSPPWSDAVWPRGFPAGPPPPKAIDVSPADVRTNQRDD